MKSRIKFGKLELGSVPGVAGIVGGPMPVSQLQGFAGRGVDIFEIRVDLFNWPAGKVIDYVKKVREALPSPLVGTIRETDLTRADRVERYVELAKFVDCVDIELGMPGWRDVVDGIGGSAVIMVSEHDFNGTPDLGGLGDIVARSVAQGAEIVKIAAMAKSHGDVTRLLRFTEDCGTPLVSISMGGIGAASRVIAPMFGSLFTYGYLRGGPVAPGQISALKLVDALKRYFPERKTPD